LCSSLQDFNLLKASHGPSAIAELLVIVAVTRQRSWLTLLALVSGLNEVSDTATTFLILDNILLERWDLCIIIVAVLTLIFIGNHVDEGRW